MIFPPTPDSAPSKMENSRLDFPALIDQLTKFQQKYIIIHTM